MAETLARKGFGNDEVREGGYRFLTTGDPELFRSLGERFLQLPLGEVEQVDVAELIGSGVTRADGRRPDELRPVEADPAFLEQPHGMPCSGRRERPASSAPPRSRKACRAGCTAPGAAG